MTADKDKYKQNVEISIILALMLIILLFFFFPRFDQKSDIILRYQAPAIEVVQIPLTYQKMNRTPRPQKPVIPVASDIIEMLDYVEIENIVKGNSLRIDDISGPVSYKDLPYTPRQLFDVLPEEIDRSVSGLIVLSLRIGKDGTVKEYKVMQNTTNCDPCLKNVVAAVQKSKWEPAIVKGKMIEYWIDKTYQF